MYQDKNTLQELTQQLEIRGNDEDKEMNNSQIDDSTEYPSSIDGTREAKNTMLGIQIKENFGIT